MNLKINHYSQVTSISLHKKLGLRLEHNVKADFNTGSLHANLGLIS